MTLQMKTTDAHLYYLGEEVPIDVGHRSFRAEVVGVNEDTVSFKILDEDRDIEELYLEWKESMTTIQETIRK